MHLIKSFRLLIMMLGLLSSEALHSPRYRPVVNSNANGNNHVSTTMTGSGPAQAPHLPFRVKPARRYTSKDVSFQKKKAAALATMISLLSMAPGDAHALHDPVASNQVNDECLEQVDSCREKSSEQFRLIKLPEYNALYTAAPNSAPELKTKPKPRSTGKASGSSSQDNSHNSPGGSISPQPHPPSSASSSSNPSAALGAAPLLQFIESGVKRHKEANKKLRDRFKKIAETTSTTIDNGNDDMIDSK